ncbi:MAG: peptidylprolyl isomerase [Bdellovibrionaceae bacterium]|nr:peptidylprolyl isomerase [Pseudobdellovibrionaceae bacterium]MDW8190270.1 peptidylprolyl isomerase [Pseudobdellovibrionaceae bacterium]
MIQFIALTLVCLKLHVLSIKTFANQWLDGVVVTVNNEAILKSDLVDLVNKIERKEFLNDLALVGLSAEELQQDIQKRIKYLIRVKMLDAEVKRLNLRITSDRLEQEIREIARRNKIPREALPKVFKEQGISFAEYQNYLKTRIEHQTLVDQEIAANIKINEEDVLSLYYNKYNKRPSYSFEVELYHIFFNPKKGGSSAARKRAENVFSLLPQKDFFQAAEQYSEDPDFQKNGFLGNFSKSDLDPSIAQAIEKHKGLGLVPEVVHSRMGYHIFYVKSRKDIPDPDYLKKKEALRAELFESRLQQALEKWFENKEKDFQIKYLKNINEFK